MDRRRSVRRTEMSMAMILPATELWRRTSLALFHRVHEWHVSCFDQGVQAPIDTLLV